MDTITEELLIIGKKLAKIEEKNDNFRDLPKWKKLRQRQDELYVELAKNKLVDLNTKLSRTNDYGVAKKISFYNNYINKGEKSK